jgi:hypothetical protein
VDKFAWICGFSSAIRNWRAYLAEIAQKLFVELEAGMETRPTRL